MSQIPVSQLSSILKGEIPVVLIYLENNVPRQFEFASPETASSMLAAIEASNQLKEGKEHGKK